MSELQHIGIRGMHWGVRKGNTATSTSSGNRTASTDHLVVSRIRKKKLSEMSNEDIKTLMNRTQLETQYRNLNPSKISAGKKIIGGILLAVATQQATAYLNKYAGAKLESFATKKVTDEAAKLVALRAAARVAQAAIDARKQS